MMKHLLMTIALISALPAWAERRLEQVDEAGFASLNVDAMDASSIYFTYTEDPSSFTDWKSNTPVEAEYLTIFPGYTEPAILKRKGAKPVTEKLTVYVSKAKAVLNRQISEADLKQMITLEDISNMDPEIKHIKIDESKFMSNVAGKEGLTNFQWKGCDPTGELIFRYKKELDLKVLNPPNRAWCSDKDRSICVESCFLFTNFLWNQGVALYNAMSDDPKDYGIASQSEARYFLNEAEMEKAYPVRELTGLDTEVIGALEQNIFYFSQVIQTGKVLAIFQKHPTDPSKTVLSSYIMMGVRTHTWKKHDQLREVLMGRDFVLNQGTSIMLGLPVFSQNMAKKIIEKLD